MSHTGRGHRSHETERGGERGHDPQRRDRESASSPFAMMRQGIDEMDRWFVSHGWDRNWMSPSSWMSNISGRGDWAPAVEAFQRGNEFVVRAELPGMARADLQ